VVAAAFATGSDVVSRDPQLAMSTPANAAAA
jgi:hypothetical protein